MTSWVVRRSPLKEGTHVTGLLALRSPAVMDCERKD
jgi:hypothetical protein